MGRPKEGGTGDLDVAGLGRTGGPNFLDVICLRSLSESKFDIIGNVALENINENALSQTFLHSRNHVRPHPEILQAAPAKINYQPPNNNFNIKSTK